MGHGGGGRLTAELVAQVFMPALHNDVLDRLGDSAVVSVDGTRLALTTDAYVVTPLFFPGGDIGALAIHGTVNDLACAGAVPLYLTAAFVIEEGMPFDDLARIAASMADAARSAGVAVVAGDTKVVDRGRGDGVYITTAGVGVLRHGFDVGPDRARPGDVVVVSGPIGQHGVAVMSVREGSSPSRGRRSCAPLLSYRKAPPSERSRPSSRNAEPMSVLPACWKSG